MKTLFFLMIGLIASTPLLGASETGEALAITSASTVKLHFKLKSKRKVIVSNKKNGPHIFQFSKGELWPSIERNLIGMKAGDKKVFELPPREAYGMWDAEKTQVVARSHLPEKKIKVGTELTAKHPDGVRALSGRIAKIMGDQVLFDFNHPLAGKTIRAEVKVIEVLS